MISNKSIKMKYTIEVSGKGAECIIHSISPEQKQKLSDGDVESDSMDQEEICEVLGIDDLFDGEPEYISGVYDNIEDYEVIVLNEHGRQVWCSTEEGFEDCEWEYAFDTDVFIAEDYQKGTFFELQLETEKFEFENLVPIVTSIGGERIELVTGFMYDGQKLEAIGCDTSSRGFSWHLV